MKKLLILIMLLLPCLADAQSGYGSHGDAIIDAGPRPFYKQTSDPSCVTNVGKVYSKEVAGEIELFYNKYIGGVCTPIQITTGGVTPVGQVTWLGTTTLAYDGNDKGTITAANAQCVTDMSDTDARVCSDNDIILLISQGDTFGGATDEVWVHDGTPGYTTFANNCDGWSSVAVGYYSGYWNLNTKIGYLSGCAMSKKYACCK